MSRTIRTLKIRDVLEAGASRDNLWSHAVDIDGLKLAVMAEGYIRQVGNEEPEILEIKVLQLSLWIDEHRQAFALDIKDFERKFNKTADRLYTLLFHSAEAALAKAKDTDWETLVDYDGDV